MNMIWARGGFYALLLVSICIATYVEFKGQTGCVVAEDGKETCGVLNPSVAFNDLWARPRDNEHKCAARITQAFEYYGEEVKWRSLLMVSILMTVLLSLLDRIARPDQAVGTDVVFFRGFIVFVIMCLYMGYRDWHVHREVAMRGKQSLRQLMAFASKRNF